MMKLSILVAVLTVVSLVGAMPPSELEEPAYIEELDKGSVALESERNHVLLHSGWVTVSGVPDTVLTRNWSWRGGVLNRISSWRASVLVSGGHASRITRTAGGEGTNHLSLRFVSREGWGFYYWIEIYGRRN